MSHKRVKRIKKENDGLCCLENDGLLICSLVWGEQKIIHKRGTQRYAYRRKYEDVKIVLKVARFLCKLMLQEEGRGSEKVEGILITPVYVRGGRKWMVSFVSHVNICNAYRERKEKKKNFALQLYVT